MLPPTTFLSACCAVLLKFVKMFFLRENLMQPLQMRFIVTKESIANVYSAIKSGAILYFHFCKPSAGMEQHE